MNYLDYFQVITLVIFLWVFFGRTIWLRQEGTKVFVLGSGKKGFTAILEKSFLIFFPIWLIEIFIHSLHLNIQFLPLVLVKQILNHQIIQFAGAVVIFAGLFVFCLALISFKSSWRVGIKFEKELIENGFNIIRKRKILGFGTYHAKKV